MARITRTAASTFVLLTALFAALLPAAAQSAFQGTDLVIADIDSGQTPDSLAQTLVGSGVTVSDVVYTGNGDAAGTFSGGEGIVGIPGGVVLSSGAVSGLAGPNSSPSSTTGASQADGDADLSALVGGATTNDAAVLEFDFVPSGGQVFFEYVFGSEEYNSFVGSSFNDVFGFFVNGQNCAVTADDQPVSVNTINNDVNAGLYLDNDAGPGNAEGRGPGPALRNTELDGLTRVLACAADVNAGVSNHLKLAIADVGDSGFDSAVFIRGSSLTSDAGSIAGTVTRETVPLANAPVHACPVASATAAECVTSRTNPNGQYLLAPVPPGNWDVTAFPPTGENLDPATREAVPILAGQPQTIDLELSPFDLAPAGTTIAPAINFGGVPLVPWNQPWTITHGDCPGGTATYTITQAGQTLRTGSLAETSTGVYTTTVPSLQPRHGYATLTITVQCPDGTTSTTPVTIYIDPSGTVQDTNGDPISGATVTLSRADTDAGPFEVVPDGDAVMSPANRRNPVTTGADGRYQWDTIPGYYVVRATAPGCTDPDNPASDFVETAVLPVPPPQLDIDLVLFCGEESTGGGPGDPGAPVTPGSGGTGTRYPDPAISDGVTRIEAGGSDDPATIALQTCDLLTEQSTGGRADSVLISRRDAFPDSLAGTPLAEANSCVLFVDGGPGGTLGSAVLDQVNRVLGGSGTAYILGGTNAVSTAIEQSLNNAGYDTVRFGGASRFETANAIAQEVLDRNPNPSQIILAYGLNWPDAVAVGAYAAALQLPIVLTDTETLHPAARDIINRVPSAEVVVMGGRFVISDAVLAEVGGTRVAGSNRMATAVAIAEQLWPNVPGSDSDFVVVNLEAADNAWQLALQAAPLAARIQAPQVGVRATQYPTETEAYLEGLGFTELPRVTMLGNLGLISGDVAAAISDDIQPG